MRKALAAVAMAAVAMTGACGPKAATPQAAPSPAPSAFVPAAGTCHAAYVTTSYANTYKPVDCAADHMSETVFVGDLPDAKARPVGGTTEAAAAFKVCDAKADQFLGGDWHAARVEARLTIPGEADWSAGARWFRCEVVQADLKPFHKPQMRQGSLKGELVKPGSPIALTCLHYDEREGGDESAVPCTRKHDSEYVGTVAVNVWSEIQDGDRIATKCRDRIGVYAGLGARADMRYRVGVWWDAPEEKEFDGGDHEVRCFAWSAQGWTRSLKSAGARALPLR
jgi:Septum formation